MCDCVLELGMWSRNNIRRKVFTLLPVVVLLFRSLGSEMRPIIKHRSVGDEGIRTCVKTFHRFLTGLFQMVTNTDLDQA